MRQKGHLVARADDFALRQLACGIAIIPERKALVLVQHLDELLAQLLGVQFVVPALPFDGRLVEQLLGLPGVAADGHHGARAQGLHFASGRQLGGLEALQGAAQHGALGNGGVEQAFRSHVDAKHSAPIDLGR